MRFDSPGFRHALALLTAFAAGWTLLIWLTGGIDVQVFGMAVRSRGVLRPAAVTVVLLVAATALSRSSLHRALSDPRGAVARVAPWAAALLAVITIVDAIRYGSFVAAGSDSYGYLSQAYRWALGELPSGYRVPLALPFASSDWVQIPLGYAPGRVAHTVVPTYAPGLPLLMALGIWAIGPIGPYLVVPIAAGAFVWGTFALGRALAGSVAGVAAALIAATSPVLLFMSLSPMSDVPAGALWTLAVALPMSDSRRGAVLGGLCAALGVLVRPNLVLLSLAPFAWIVWTARARERQLRAAAFAAPVAAAAAAIGALNAFWYGSPFLSGYGAPKQLYSAAAVWPNLHRYPVWLAQSHSPLVLLAAVPLLRINPRIAAACGILILTVLSYLAYAPYDQWWYLRFLLPGLGALFALMACGLWMIATGTGRPWTRILAVALFAVIIARSAAYTKALDMFGPLQESEHKYIDVGAFVAAETGPNAVFFAMQHSGSIRFYGDRYTLRYDRLDRDTGSRAPAALERLGLHPYLAVEDAELDAARKAFALPDGPLPWPYVARTRRFGGFSIFDLAAQPWPHAPREIPIAGHIRYAVPQPVDY